MYINGSKRLYFHTMQIDSSVMLNKIDSAIIVVDMHPGIGAGAEWKGVRGAGGDEDNLVHRGWNRSIRRYWNFLSSWRSSWSRVRSRREERTGGRWQWQRWRGSRDWPAGWHHGLSSATILPQVEQLRQQLGDSLLEPLQKRESHRCHPVLRG